MLQCPRRGQLVTQVSSNDGSDKVPKVPRRKASAKKLLAGSGGNARGAAAHETSQSTHLGASSLSQSTWGDVAAADNSERDEGMPESCRRGVRQPVSAVTVDTDEDEDGDDGLALVSCLTSAHSLFSEHQVLIHFYTRRMRTEMSTQARWERCAKSGMPFPMRSTATGPWTMRESTPEKIVGQREGRCLATAGSIDVGGVSGAPPTPLDRASVESKFEN